MTTISTYLYFNGNCEEVFDFYKLIFMKDFQYVGRYKDVPEIVRRNFPHCTDEQIMHITLPISNETVLMGADVTGSNDKENMSTNNFSLYLSTDSKKEADRLFNCLVEGGEIKLPMSEQFWGSYYGICLDKFGVNWKINFSSDTI